MSVAAAAAMIAVVVLSGSGRLTRAQNGTISGGSIVVKRMVGSKYCEKQVLMGDHLYRSLPVRSRVECVATCRLDSTCVSVVYEEDSYQCRLGDTMAYENCSNMEAAASGKTFYQEPPPCTSGEVLGPSGFCICAPGFSGTPCTRYFHDCSDHYSYGNWQGDGVYSVFPLNFPNPFDVYCRYITNPRLHVMTRKRAKNAENFNRTWVDYRDGFGDLYNDFWLGLEKVHALTSVRSYKLRITIKIANGTSYIQVYEDFKVTNEATGYRLHFNASYTNGPDDCFLPLLNARFSTYDHDRDEDNGVNCALKRAGGFWFRGSGCNTCNPHGIIYQTADGLLAGTEDEAFWAFLGNVAPLKITMFLVPL